MGVLNSKQDAQEKISILRHMSLEDFQFSLAKLSELNKVKCQTQLSKWDLQLITHLSQIDSKKVIHLLTGSENSAHVNLHHLLLSLLLSSQHFKHCQDPLSAKIEAIIQTLCFVDETTYRVTKEDFNYLFKLAYFQVRIATNLVFTTTQIEQDIAKELFGNPSPGSVEIKKLAKALEENEDVVNFITLFATEPIVNISPSSPSGGQTEYRGSPPPRIAIEGTQSKGTLKHQTSDVQSMVSAAESANPIAFDGNSKLQVHQMDGMSSKQALETASNLGGAASVAPDSRLYGRQASQASGPVVSGSAMRGPSQMKPGDTTTIDLMYSYENGKAPVFQEDTIKKMGAKLKAIRTQNGGLVDHEYDMKLQNYIQILELVETSHADFYAQRQMTQLMRSIYMENKLQNLSLAGFTKDPHLALSGDQIKSVSQDGKSELSQYAPPEGMARQNAARVNMAVQNVFREFNQQYQTEIKYTLSKYFYKLLEAMKSRGKKVVIETEKFQHLGEIAGYSQLIFELEESENQISSDQIFNMIYDCYDQMTKFAGKKEVIIKYAQLKYAKRVCGLWISFLSGVLLKIKQALTLPCLADGEYFREAFDKTTQMLEEQVKKLKEVANDYYEVKRIVLDYNYQLGRLKALLYVAQRYKEENEKLIEEIKVKIRSVRESMEKVDLKLVQCFHGVIQRKRCQALYFNTLGQASLSKCAIKGLDSTFVREYMVQKLIQYNYWQMMMCYSEQQRKSKIDEDKYLQESFDTILFDVMRFQKIKQIDETVFQNIKQQGVMGFDKYRNYTLQLGEEEEKLVQSYKALQNLASASPTTQVKGQSQNMQSDRIRQGAVRNAVGVMNSFNVSNKSDRGQKSNAAKSQLATQEMISHVSQQIEMEYTIASSRDRLVKIGTYFLERLPDQPIDFVGTDSFKPDFEAYLADQMNFVEILPGQGEQQTETIPCKGKYIFNHSIRENSTFMLDKRTQAHMQCEQFLKQLSSQKQSKFIKEFKEERTHALEAFVKALSSINKSGRFNNFNLRYLGVPLEGSIESTFLSNYMMDCFISDQEKEQMWKNMSSANHQQLSSTQLPAGFDQDDKPAQMSSPVDEERKTFDILFSTMKGIGKLRCMSKEKLLRPFYRLYERYSIQNAVQRDIIPLFLAKEGEFRDVSQIDKMINDRLSTHSEDPNSENAEIEDLLQNFSNQRTTFFERKRIRGIELFIQGAQNYLNTINPQPVSPNSSSSDLVSDPKNEFVDKVAKQIQSVYESHMGEYKLQVKVNIQNVQAQFKDKGDRLAKKVYKIEFLTQLAKKVAKHKSASSFFSYLRDLSQELEEQHQRIDKVLNYFKSNFEDMEEQEFLKMGARTMHSILSGQFQPEDIELLNHMQTSSDDQATAEKHRLIRILSLFVSRLAFIDERISSKQLLRHDMPPAVFNQARLRCRIQCDRYSLREQFHEGLTSLVNIFEIYKTPILHYQRSYDRVCKFVRKELVQRIVEADDGYMKFLLFDLISGKGSAAFKNIVNRLDQAFGKLDLDEPIRLETEKVKGKLRRELDLQVRAFKEFIDLEENQKASGAKTQQIEHQNFRLMQELAALMLLIRIFYVKLEQEESAFPVLTAGQTASQKALMATAGNLLTQTAGGNDRINPHLI